MRRPTPWVREECIQSDSLPAECDVVIVGGGLSGLACGRFLAAGGADVVVLEVSWRGRVAGAGHARPRLVLRIGPAHLGLLWKGAEAARAKRTSDREMRERKKKRKKKKRKGRERRVSERDRKAGG